MKLAAVWSAEKTTAAWINGYAGILKRMVRFKKWLRNLFFSLQGHNVPYQQQKLSKFLMELITIIQSMHMGSHDTHPHGNQTHPTLDVAWPL
jgi:hypothetical protein